MKLKKRTPSLSNIHSANALRIISDDISLYKKNDKINKLNYDIFINISGTRIEYKDVTNQTIIYRRRR